MASQYQIDRAGHRDTAPHSDFHTDADHLLSRQPISDETRAAAFRVVQMWAPDLLHMLGLGGPQPGEPLAPIDVVCPGCGSAATNRCTNAAGRDKEKFCTSRIRFAANTTAADVLIDDVLQEA